MKDTVGYNSGRLWIVKTLCMRFKGEKTPWIDVMVGRVKEKHLDYCTKRKQYLDKRYTEKDCSYCNDYSPLR